MRSARCSFDFGLEFSGEAEGPNGEVSFASTDDLSRTILFNNSVNDVRLTSTVTFNVAIDNYNQALAQNAASSIAAGVLSNALLLSAPQN